MQGSFDFPRTAHLEPGGSCPADFSRGGMPTHGADLNADGEVTTLDVLAFLNAWVGCA